MSVDFPAPFCPTRPCTSPGMTEMETPSSAMVAPKRFLMSLISRRGTDMCMEGRAPSRPHSPNRFGRSRTLQARRLLLHAVLFQWRIHQVLDLLRVDVRRSRQMHAGVDALVDGFSVQNVHHGLDAEISHVDRVLKHQAMDFA